MLVLSRRPEEWIDIRIPRADAEDILNSLGEIRIQVMLTELRPDKARLGFTADRRIRIHRSENSDEVRIELDRRARSRAGVDGGVTL